MTFEMSHSGVILLTLTVVDTEQMRTDTNPHDQDIHNHYVHFMHVGYAQLKSYCFCIFSHL